MGIRPYLGRFFSPGDDKSDTSAAVMTWSCWKRLGSDRQIEVSDLRPDHRRRDSAGIHRGPFTASTAIFSAIP